MTKVDKKTPRQRIDNTQLLADNPDIRVRHFHMVGNMRSMTVAYRDGHSTLEIATAVVNPLDTFSRKEGTKFAIEHMLAGRTTILPKIMDFDGRAASAAWTLAKTFML